MLYVACGDGGSGEQSGAMRQNPPRLDTLVGKILRIVPDLSLHPRTTTISENGRYRIPGDNPFVDVAGARREIWAYGFRNPHRLTWDVDPASGTDRLIAASIGLSTWEAIYFVHKGANYGYPAREGNQVLQADNTTAPLPAVDEVPIQISDRQTKGTAVPIYPVAQYEHTASGGDAITGGFVYRGTLLAPLVGKFVFGDITTGKIWFTELTEMIAADDANPMTLATLHPLQLLWNDRADASREGRDASRGVRLQADPPSNDKVTPDAVRQLFPTMFPVVLAAYKARGGIDPDLPGQSTVSGPGRADIRFAVDAAGELYILSKADGMIRAVTGVTAITSQPVRN